MRSQSFVVWMDPADDPSGPPTCTGRVEHVATAERRHFANAEELIAILTRRESGASPDPDGDGGDGGDPAEWRSPAPTRRDT